MKIRLIAPGKTQSPGLKSAILDYVGRLKHYAKFEFVELPEDKLEAYLEKIDNLYLLDESGQEFDSVEFADFLDKRLIAGKKELNFAIGGPYGFSQASKNRASDLISLSAMTFPHDLVRVIFLEQLFRAFTILRNEKYHHG